MKLYKFTLKMAYFILTFIIASLLVFNCARPQQEGVQKMGLNEDVKKKTINELVDKFGEEQRARIETGISQVSTRWKTSDGNEVEFREFCLKHFTTNQTELDKILGRFQQNLKSLYGNLHQISREFNWALHVDIGPVLPIDYLFANYDPFSHVSEDVFSTKLAFVALLNYPIATLKEKNEMGMKWSRKKWAETRLVEEFASRIPGNVAQNRSQTYVAADDYISNYNIYMHRLLNKGGKRLFAEGLKLISHWGLRDELKAQYANEDGFPRQKIIQQIMERIIRQEIPKSVINSKNYDWNPYNNTAFKTGTDEQIQVETEPNTRYQHIWNIYQAERKLDPYVPHAPSLIDRRFKVKRELPKAEVEALLKSILSAPVLKDISQIIEQRLGRSLEPFDIWYNGFKSRADYNEAELDKIVGNRYATVEAFQEDLPFILRNLGFSPQKAEFLSEHIDVDPSRGAGHAMGAMMPRDKAHLRTRIPEEGMKYKGFNIAIHELGHNVEQVFSLNGVDYYTLNGVPNTAFTEAFAFVFQSRDLSVLGLDGKSEGKAHLRALNDMWSTFEIAGVALTDMYIWRWLYEHPDANPQKLKDATLNIAKQVWNDYFAPVLGKKDKELLAIYSHIVDGGMYTPDYPLGLMISFQIEQYLKEHLLAKEMERMCKLGRLSPQVWMQQAVGNKVSAQPLIQAANDAVKQYAK